MSATSLLLARLVVWLVFANEYSFSGNECVFRPITDEEKQLMKLIKSDLERLNHCSNFGEIEIIGFVRYERPKSVD